MSSFRALVSESVNAGIGSNVRAYLGRLLDTGTELLLWDQKFTKMKTFPKRWRGRLCIWRLVCGVGRRRETGQAVEDSGTGPGVAADAGAEEEQTVALIQDTARDSEPAGPRRCCGCTRKPLQPLTKLFKIGRASCRERVSSPV